MILNHKKFFLGYSYSIHIYQNSNLLAPIDWFQLVYGLFGQSNKAKEQLRSFCLIFTLWLQHNYFQNLKKRAAGDASWPSLKQYENVNETQLNEFGVIECFRGITGPQEGLTIQEGGVGICNVVGIICPSWLEQE